MVVDDVGQAAFEAAAGFAGCLAFGDLAEVVLAAGSGVPGLGDGDDADGGVELAVAAAREPVADMVAAGGVDGGGAGVAGVVVLVREAADVTGERATQLVRIRGSRPAGPAPQPAAELLRVERRVSCRGAIMVAKQRIHVGIQHAGKTVTVEVDDHTLNRPGFDAASFCEKDADHAQAVTP